MINRGNRILIVFHLYSYSKHELSTILVRFVMLLCNLSLYILFMIGFTLWDKVSLNLAQ